MKYRFIAIVLTLLITFTAKGQFGPGGGGEILDSGPSDEMSEKQRAEIQAGIQANIERLRSEGKLNFPIRTHPPQFEWPVKAAPGIDDFFSDVLQNFVDHNPAYPDLLQDWNCGTRTYDRADGYNHRGTDIRSWPFAWRRVEENGIEAAAAASGVIVQKIDGMPDRNCVLGAPLWNAVYVQHADGSIAWYGHLKNGSLTTKEIGDHVETGEYLGVIASSGSSNIPHLHFEIYSAEGQLQDPFAGPCNMMNAESWWIEQPQYNDTQINALMTGSAPPNINTCPAPEITNEKAVFQPGELVVPSAYFRYLQPGDTISFSLVQPDGGIFRAWTYVAGNEFRVTYRFAQWDLPTDAPLGTWKYRVELDGVTRELEFYVGQPEPVSVSGRISRRNGSGIFRARVTLEAEDGSGTRSAVTNPFGYYRFDDVEIGKRYAVRTSAKNHVFNDRVITPRYQISDLDLMPR